MKSRICATCKQPGHFAKTCTPRTRLRWEDDHNAQRLVEAHPDGMSTADVALYFGITRQALYTIEHRALEKMRQALDH